MGEATADTFAVLRELCEAIERQLAYTGKGAKPSDRLAEALAAAHAALEAHEAAS